MKIINTAQIGQEIICLKIISKKKNKNCGKSENQYK